MWKKNVKLIFPLAWLTLNITEFQWTMYKNHIWDFLGSSGLRLQPSTAEGIGSVPSYGTKILHATRHGLKKTSNNSNNKNPYMLIVIICWNCHPHDENNSRATVSFCLWLIHGYFKFHLNFSDDQCESKCFSKFMEFL